MNLTDIPDFIKKHIIKRERSLLADDMEKNAGQLERAIAGKSVMVIGGAGTIGFAFIKALLSFRPERLFVVDTNENALTEITRDLRSTFGQYVPGTYRTYPMNFGDDVFQKMLIREGPFDIIANFAAHKHVRSEKDHYAIEAMIDNNIFMPKITQCIIAAASINGFTRIGKWWYWQATIGGTCFELILISHSDPYITNNNIVTTY